MQLRERDEHGTKRAVSFERGTQYERRWRKELQRVNATIARAQLALDGEQSWLQRSGSDSMRYIATTQHSSLYRVFNNASWQHGGRLFGGWWQNLAKQKRLRITVAGERVAEVDWHAMFLRLAYAHCNAVWPFKDSDGYSDNERDRDGSKVLTFAMLHAEQPLKQWPATSVRERGKLVSKFPAGTKASTLYARIAARHVVIADRAFGCGLGHRLTRVESDLLVSVLLELADRDVVALLVHDSLVVPESCADVATTVMVEVARDRGLELPTRITWAKPEPTRHVLP